jgi:serine/threonine-protein kinase HipA
MPETKLFEGKYFGVRRYDRTAEGKVHTISVAGLLNADYRVPCLEYIHLLQICQRLTADMEQVYALFREMVFNVAICNRDDHAKNFSFQLIGNEWRLSPAYDVLPSAGFNGYHTTTINNQGDPSWDDVIAVATFVGLNKKRALTIRDEVIDTCKQKNMYLKKK